MSYVDVASCGLLGLWRRLAIPVWAAFAEWLGPFEPFKLSPRVSTRALSTLWQVMSLARMNNFGAQNPHYYKELRLWGRVPGFRTRAVRHEPIQTFAIKFSAPEEAGAQICTASALA